MNKNLVKIILNPISGQGLGEKLLPRFVQELARRGLDVSVFKTTSAGDAKREVEKLSKKTRTILCLGGDGTMNEIINGLGKKNIPIAQYPLGTANVLAKEFNFTKSVCKICDLIAKKSCVEIDIGIVNGKKFFLVVGIGFDGRVTQELAKVRKGNIGFRNYVLPMLKSFLEFELSEITVKIDGKTVENYATGVTIANTKSYGGPFEIASNADCTDGLLDVVVFNAQTKSDLLRHIVGTFIGNHTNFYDVKYYNAKEVEITTTSGNKIPYQVDGDFTGFLPVNIKVYEEKIRIVVEK